MDCRNSSPGKLVLAAGAVDTVFYINEYPEGGSSKPSPLATGLIKQAENTESSPIQYEVTRSHYLPPGNFKKIIFDFSSALMAANRTVNFK